MPDIASLSKNKIIFFAVTGVLILSIIIGISTLGSSGTKKTGSSAAKELTIWVVGDETAGFSDIIIGFKARYPDYKNTEIKVTKFGNYADYEKTLLTVLGDGNSPDIFVVSSSDGGLLESKILAIPANVINPDDFAKNFNKVFDDLVIENKEKDDSGKERTVSGIKGVPLGYQAMGVFYNWKLVKTIPRIWAEIPGNTLSDESTSADNNKDYVNIMFGLDGKYIPGAPDILSLFFLQNSIITYDKLSETNANKAMDQYLSFSPKPSVATATEIQSVMKDLNLTTVDMFVRGKISMIVGFPSLIREIEYAIKRAGSENILTKLSLRTSEIPQTSLDPKDAVNLAEYTYFALSKTSPNIQSSYAFLSYLSSREAEEKYLNNFPLYLPAQRLQEEAKMNESISKDYERVKYRSFMNGDVLIETFNKGMKNEYDTYFSQILGNLQKAPKDMLLGAIKYVDCNRKHLLEFISLEEECRIE